MSSEEGRLKACPLCAGKALSVKDHDKSHQIFCIKCDIGVCESNEAECLAIWQCRPLESAARRAALEEVLKALESWAEGWSAPIPPMNTWHNGVGDTVDFVKRFIEEAK